MDRIAALASGVAYADPLRDGDQDPDRRRARRSGTPEEDDRRRPGLDRRDVARRRSPGAVLIGVAAYQGYKGVTEKFLDDSKTGEMSRGVKRAFTALGVFGHVARVVVFALVGYGLIKAALDYDPHKAVGLDGALRKLADASYGPWLLGLVAAGLVGFAAVLGRRRALPQGLTH